MWSLAAVAFVTIYFFKVPFPLIIRAAAIIGLIGGKVREKKFLVVNARASAHFLVDGKEFTESGRNPRKALISGVSTRRRSGRAANTVLPEQSPNRRENPRIRPCS